MFRILLSLVAVTVLSSGQLALATEGRQETPEQAHALTDTNKDGAVDREEFRARMVDIFYFWLDPRTRESASAVTLPASALRSADGRETRASTWAAAARTWVSG